MNILGAGASGAAYFGINRNHAFTSHYDEVPALAAAGAEVGAAHFESG